MKLDNLGPEECKLFLNVSEGFPSQTSKARIKKGSLSPSKAGHSLAEHLRGVASATLKTKFCSKNDMALALSLLLNSAEGKAALDRLEPGKRVPLESRIGQPFGVDAYIAELGKRVTFSRSDMVKARVNGVTCVAILEGRVRNGEDLLHVQTFYPTLSEDEITRLLNIKETPAGF